MCMPFLIEQVLLLSKSSHWNTLTTMTRGAVLDVLCQEHANNDSNLGQDQLLIQGHSLIDMHPLFKEKLKKGKNILDNIIKDGNQCFFASGAQHFVSEDETTSKKADFLYEAYGIK